MTDTSGVIHVSRRHASDLGVMIGDTIFPSPIHAIHELGGNAHDADASTFSVIYQPGSQGRLVLEDDGFGMSPGQGLEDFFQIGGSTKRDLKREGKTTPRGRRPIGNFGWGSLAVRYLAQSHVFESWRGGVYSRVEEVFSETDQDYDPIRVVTQSCDPQLHGTKLTLTNLREVTQSINLDHLMRSLSTQMPVELSDFQMRVNGVQVTPPALTAATKYVFGVSDKELGEVTGTIYYSPKNLGDLSGVYVKVNGRAIGGRNLDLLTTLSAAMASRTYAVAHAQGMETEIRFTRREVGTGEKADRLYGILETELRRVRQDQEGSAVDTKLHDAYRFVAEQLPLLGTRLARVLGEEGAYTFNFSDTRAGDMLNVDRSGKIVYVNPRSDAFRMHGVARREIDSTLALLLERSLACAVTTRPADWSRMALLAQELGKESHPRVGKGRSFYLKDVLPRAEVPGEKADSTLPIVPTRLYSYHEAALRSGWHRELQKRLAEAGRLTTTHEQVLGSDLETAMAALSDYTTLFQVVRGIAIPDGMSAAWPGNTERKIEARLNRDPSSRPSWILDLNQTEEGNSLYAVHSKDITRFKEYILGRSTDEVDYSTLESPFEVATVLSTQYQSAFTNRFFADLVKRCVLRADVFQFNSTQEEVKVVAADLASRLSHLGLGERPSSGHIHLTQLSELLYVTSDDDLENAFAHLTQPTGSRMVSYDVARSLYQALVTGFCRTIQDNLSRNSVMKGLGYLTANEAIKSMGERGIRPRDAQVGLTRAGESRVLGMYHRDFVSSYVPSSPVGPKT
ncbi:ATP-binding protein [Candidatus Woesearchaeota archaeon]|nr:ATP-binding protein [Candidatus Woesearchaeota archaeon]